MSWELVIVCQMSSIQEDKMEYTLILGLLGGLALFLYGMQMMSNGLEAAAGNRMKQILEKLTSNRILGVVVGAIITAVIQSSSATTVMVVGFVNSGLMRLQQAVWIIMGANIGTTITGQLIALDVGAIAPLFAFLGVAAIVFLKKPMLYHIGGIIAGLGILFIGMDMMGAAMYPLRESEAFINLMTQFSNPVLGILAGMVFTALIQSSSASVGILQTLAIGGLIGLDSAVFVLFGQNIGTCITAVLAAIGTSKSAKRTTVIHLTFNMIGTVIFTIVCIVTPLVGVVESWTPSNPAAQIANMHTLFNIVTTLLLIPFGTYLAKFAEKIMPDKVEDMPKDTYYLEFIKPLEQGAEYQMGNTAIAVNGIKRELERMTDMVKSNIHDSFEAVMERKTKRLEMVQEREEYIDYLNKEVSKYISNTMIRENNEDDVRLLNTYFKITGNLERIGDHAINICEYTTMLQEKNIKFSETALAEIAEMSRVCQEAIEAVCGMDISSAKHLAEVAALEQKMDDMTVMYRQNQLNRMRESQCESEAGIIYSEMLTDFERIGDHILNIGQELTIVKG